MRLQLVTPPIYSMTGLLTIGQAAVSALAVVGGAPFSAMSYLPFVGQPVSGVGIAAGSVVQTVVDGTDITLSQVATAGGTQTITFGAEPVSLVEALTHCRFEIPPGDPVYASESALVGVLISAARRYAETRLRSALVTQTWALYLDSFPSAGGYYNRAIREIWPSMGSLPSGLGFMPGLIPNSTGVIDLPLPPVQSVVSVKYWDFQNTLQTVSPATYNASLGFSARLQPQYSTVWPISRPTIDSVVITFTCGYGPSELNVPADVQVAIKYLVATWYENREHVSPGVYMTVPDTVDALFSVADPGIYG